MLIRSNCANRGLLMRCTFKDEPHQIVIFHAEAFSEMLARRLILRAEDDAAQIKEDCANTHLLFFFAAVVFFGLAEDFASAAFSFAFAPALAR